MQFTQLIGVLTARWRSIVSTLAIAVAIAVAANIIMPATYTSSASIVLDVKSPDPIAGMILPGMSGFGYMATQIGILQSERVARQVVDKLDLGSDEAYEAFIAQTGGNGDYKTWLAKQLIAKLEVVPTRESNIITINFSSADPKLAAQVANEYVSAYMRTTAELRSEPAKEYSMFFAQNAKQYRSDLEVAQAKLSNFQKANNIVSANEREDIEAERLSELSSQVVRAQSIAEEARKRAEEAVAGPDRVSQAFASANLTGMSAEIAKGRARLDEIGERLGSAHPQVRELQANLAQLDARRNAELKRITANAQSEYSVHRDQLTQLQVSLREQRERLLRLRGLRDELFVLQRDADNAQRAYDAAVSRLTQSSVESQSTQTNVSLLMAASEASKPSSPRPLLNIAVAISVGLFIGALLAVVQEQLDSRTRTIEDIYTLCPGTFAMKLPFSPTAADSRATFPLLGKSS